MIDTLIELDKSIFFFLNGLHADWLDPIMFWISDKEIWIPFYLFLAGWLIKKFKKKSIIYLLGIGIAITITDQVISGFMKGYFERFRPSRDPELEGLVHTVNGIAFALAIFIFLSFKEYKWIWLMFVWAAVVAYSRVYLGVHFPGDILVGGIIGLITAYSIYHLAQKVIPRIWKA